MSIPYRTPGLRQPAIRVDPGLTLSAFIGWGWGMLTVGGAVLLLGTGVVSTGASLSVPRAVFHAVSAATLTGFATTVGIAELTQYGRTIVLALTVVGILGSLSVGGLAAKRLAGLKVADGTVITAAFALLAVASVVGLLTRDTVGAFGALANSGITAGGGYGGGGLASATGVLLLLPLCAAGSLGVVVLLDVWERLRGCSAALSPFTWDSMVGTAAVFLTLAVAIWLLADGSMYLPALTQAVTASASSMGWGVEGLSGEASRSTKMALLLPAILGVGAGGTAAGLGIATLLHVIRSLVGAIRARVFPATAAVGVGLLFALAGLIALTWLTLLSTEPQSPADRLFAFAVGAATNAATGGKDPVSVVGLGMFTMSLSMLAGRVLTLAALWAMALLSERDRHA